MRRTTLQITKAKVRGERYWCVTVPKVCGGRTRRFFKGTPEGKREAETFLELSKRQKENFGTAALTLTEKERAEYLECTAALKPYGITLRAAVDLILPNLKARNRSCTVKELVAEFLKIKKADGASIRYLEDLRSRLGQFVEGFDGRPVASISGVEIDGWLRALPVAATTRNNFRRVLIVAFNFALQHGYCVTNPAENSAKAKEIETPVGILTPAKTARLLESCPAEIVPFVAIGAFAGLRRAELERLDWSEVDLESGLIQVVASKAKSARRRFVKVRENLDGWIRPLAKRSGPVTPSNYRDLFDTARETAKVKDWPSNALRHSFASYSLAHENDAAKLALELGHTDANLIFQHYRELVKPSDAERYWSIRPVAAANVVSMTA